MYYRFRSHPSPGIFENGRLVTVDNEGKTSVLKKVKADTSSGYGTGGVGEIGGTGGYGGMVGAGGGSAPMNDLYNPVWDRLEQGTVLEDWIPRDAAGLDQMFMLMYHRCPIAGTIVDLIAETIWSDFDLVGISDPAIRDIYESSMQAIDVVATMPDITREYLVLGRSISSLIFDKEKGIFKDLISHDPSLVRLTPIPIKGFDPKIDLIPSPRFREFVESQDPRDIDARKLLPQAYINAVKNVGGGGGAGLGWGLPSAHSTGSQNISGIPLDPVNTLFIARRVFNYDTIGTSLYTRLISFWALEKALINASVTSARRRIRSILHVKAGIDNLWEASAAELDNLASMFIQAEQDPVGAVVVTRTGVDATELRQGNDFYKWSDEWSMLTEGKLRALGANDALLCLDHDTLIPTEEHGIITIGHFGKEAHKKSLTTVGRKGKDTTRNWLYSGKGKVVEVVTYNGNDVVCTPDHQILSLSGNDLIWKKAKDLKSGDTLCINKTKCTRKTPLTFELHTPPKGKYAHSYNGEITKPSTMTPELAYIIGILVSEGCISKYRLRISNTDKNILIRTKEMLEKVFGNRVRITIKKSSVKVGSESIDKYGTVWRTKKQPYELCLWSIIITDYLKQLGVKISKGRTSREKTIPWSILQADEQSQLAFIAAYIDGDGTVKRQGKEIVIYSHSPRLLKQMQVMLNAHGHDSLVRDVSLRMASGNASEISLKLAQYSCSTKFKTLVVPEIPHREYGIPTQGLRSLIKARFVRKITNVGSLFINDQGKEVVIRKWGKKNYTRWDTLLYSTFKEGGYEKLMSDLHKISPSEHDKLMNLFSKGFKFTKLVKVATLKESRHVYDIQMKNDPSFSANGIVVHNSGDATYSNQESARMFFMEKAANLRTVLTKRIFYNRMFPLIARIHGFVKRSKAELDHGIRMTQREAMSIPNNELILPDIAWKKELVNSFDEKRMEMLEKMDSKEVPITLRSWAAAANFNIDGELAELENDAILRKKITQWKAQWNPEASDQQSQLDLANSIRNLAQSNLQKVVGSAMEDLGQLRSFLFWDREGKFAGVSAIAIAEFLKGIDPNANNVRILVDPTALRVALAKHFKSDVQIDIGHYLVFRSGLTSIRPVMSKRSQAAACDALKNSADNFAGQSGLYEVLKLIESEVQLVLGLDSEHKEAGFRRLNKTLDKIPLPVKDPISASSPTLYSGREKD